MPFVNAEHREHPDINIPGDRCYLFYREMVFKWKAEPRWTTADEIYGWVKDQHNDPLMQRAKELAWTEFYRNHVAPYEDKKRKENGDI